MGTSTVPGNVIGYCWLTATDNTGYVLALVAFFVVRASIATKQPSSSLAVAYRCAAVDKKLNHHLLLLRVVVLPSTTTEKRISHILLPEKLLFFEAIVGNTVLNDILIPLLQK